MGRCALKAGPQWVVSGKALPLRLRTSQLSYENNVTHLACMNHSEHVGQPPYRMTMDYGCFILLILSLIDKVTGTEVEWFLNGLASPTPCQLQSNHWRAPVPIGNFLAAERLACEAEVRNLWMHIFHSLVSAAVSHSEAEFGELQSEFS